MGFFDLFRPDSHVLREKIIYTQKQRIVKLEAELDELKENLKQKHEDSDRARNNFDKAKERLVDQIIELSDKFAENNQRTLDVAAENAKLKMLMHETKQTVLLGADVPNGKKTSKVGKTTVKKAATRGKKKAKK